MSDSLIGFEGIPYDLNRMPLESAVVSYEIIEYLRRLTTILRPHDCPWCSCQSRGGTHPDSCPINRMETIRRALKERIQKEL